MEMYNKPGTKERLFEMMNGVNKTQINEMVTPETNQIVSMAFEKLRSGALRADKGGSDKSIMQVLDDATYVGINGYDKEGNMYNFNFKITGTEGDQDGVTNVNDVILEKFFYQNPQGQKVVELDQNDLSQFNSANSSKFYDVVDKYVDIDIQTADEMEGMDETINIEIKPDSQPFGGSKEEFQDGSGYVDEKPPNPELRVDSPELDKYVKESTDEDKYENIVFIQGEEANQPLEILSNQGEDAALDYLKQWHQPGSHEGIDEPGHGTADKTYERDGYVMSWNPYIGYIGLVYDLSNMNENDEIVDDEVENDEVNPETDQQDDFDIDTTFVNSKNPDNPIMKMLSGEFDITPETPEDDVPAVDCNDVDNDGDNIEGGLADNTSVLEFDPEQILKGLEVEMGEHTKDPKVALEITMDHLEEDPQYYGGENQDPDKMAMLAAQDDAEENEDDDTENKILGYTTDTPNTLEELSEDQKRYDELNGILLESLSSDEKSELYELWEKFN
jgi:hypothetical protein